MQFSSTLEADKHGYYHPLSDTESSPPSEADRGKFQKHEASHGAPAQRKTRLNKYAFAGALLASTNSILLGYDIGVMSGAVLYIKDDLGITSTQVEVLVGCLNLCSLIGSFASGRTSDYIGRRYTIVLAAATFLIGAILMGLAPSFGFLMAGRVVAGIGVGYSLMIAPVYTAELSPAMTRGFLSSLPEVFINIGALLGYISNYALSGLPYNINWRLMLGLAAFPSIIVALGVMVMPESPRWLVMKGRFGEAKKVLVKTSDSEEEAELRLREMIKAAKDLTHGAGSSNWKGQGAWKELLFEPSRPIRRILISAIGINFFMQASGNDAVMYYTPAVFKDVGIKSRQQLLGVTIIMGIAKTCFVIVSALFLDSFGRRPLLLLGTIGMAVSLAALGIGSKYLGNMDNKPSWAIVLCIVAVCADVSFFSIGLGPITWVYSSEIFPMRLRAQGSSLAISVNRLVSGIVAMTFLSISRLISFGGMFFSLSGIMVLATFFIYFYLPETKGKTLEEIGLLFEDEVPENERHFVS
ncbi:polyol transporter 5-like [Mercurialis annua]|uniref:polyol transporter 5-like n=1 Tax=Mercurialis annua TaxID=3986 RepID=UPI0021610973|nr:polyol transporter 5-like [Mercurialis annua]XP_050216321.1 polyol transporter 5-like [Mercurialis annua]XP_050216322.1 polyol transporter 5-like [Mercurialis annua]XP_050216323.1 polyol transporter 5-like [Mercurialis annua]XP_050216324.1 polyol transporter 5-like [Mercurialis annua]